MADDPFSNNISEIVAAFLQNGYTVTPVTKADPLPVALPDGPLPVILPQSPLPVTLPDGPLPVSLPESPLPVVLPNGPLGEVSLPTLFPQAWVSGVKDMRAYSGVTVQVHGLSGGDTIQLNQSYDGTNTFVQSWSKNDLTVGSVISSDGAYTFIGGGYVSFVRTGNASAPTLTICGSN